MENEKKAWQTPELQEMAVVVLSLHQKWWQKMAAGLNSNIRCIEISLW